MTSENKAITNQPVNLLDQSELKDGFIKSLTDADADNLNPEHIDDLNDEWSKTIAEEHFKTAGLILTEHSFDHLTNKEIFLEMLKDQESFDKISKHPFEWLDKKHCIKLFNILRTLDPNIKQLHEVSKDGLRFTILEWQHIYSYLKTVCMQPTLSAKHKEHAENLVALFSMRFSGIENLSISEDLIVRFCFSQAQHDKTWNNLRRSKWVLAAITFLLMLVEMSVVDDKIFKVISLITMLSAFAVFYYHQYVYPKKYRESGRLQMICEKLIMQSY